MAEYDHWIPLNVGDYLADTMHLSTLQHGVYIRLIMHYWKRRELVGDDRVLAQIAGVSLHTWGRVSGPVLALFRVVSGDVSQNRESRFSHLRLDTELAKARALSELRKAAGQAGAGVRWGWQLPISKDSKSTVLPMATTSQRQGVGVRTPTTPKKEPSKPPAAREASVISFSVKAKGQDDGA